VAPAHPEAWQEGGRQAAGQHSTTTLLVAAVAAEWLLPGHVALSGLAVK